VSRVTIIFWVRIENINKLNLTIDLNCVILPNKKYKLLSRVGRGTGPEKPRGKHHAGANSRGRKIPRDKI